jgi:hypothetical protein
MKHHGRPNIKRIARGHPIELDAASYPSYADIFSVHIIQFSQLSQHRRIVHTSSASPSTQF